MKVIDCDWKKRNGNGQSTCHLCNKLTWDSWCYDFELKILDKELFNTILCGDCICDSLREVYASINQNITVLNIDALDILKDIISDFSDNELLCYVENRYDKV